MNVGIIGVGWAIDHSKRTDQVAVGSEGELESPGRLTSEPSWCLPGDMNPCPVQALARPLSVRREHAVHLAGAPRA
jgi:hypothetical protein